MKEDIVHLLRVAAKAFKAFKNNYKPNTDCGVLFENITKILQEELSDYKLIYDFLCGKDTLGVDGITKNYIPQTGDTVIIDLSIGKNGIWCDVCRTFFVGKCSPEQSDSYELVLTSLRAGEKCLKAGVTAREMYCVVSEELKKRGNELIHHAGHRIGGEPVMEPQFVAENFTKLDNGIFVTIETGCYNEFGIRLENDYYINENNAENLIERFLSLDIEEYILA